MAGTPLKIDICLSKHINLVYFKRDPCDEKLSTPWIWIIKGLGSAFAI